MCAASRPRNKRLAPLGFILLVGAGLALLAWSAGLFAAPLQEEDLSYLMPIPHATRAAFRVDSPIETNLQAVLYAQANAGGVHFRPIGTPQAVAVEQCRPSDVDWRTKADWATCKSPQPGEDFVWLVVLHANWNIQPPPAAGGSPSPTSVVSGCQCVVFPASAAQRSSVGWSSRSCPCK
jgi:hypothetical protein